MIEAYMNATLDVLRLAGQMFLQRIDYELRRFAEDLHDFIYDLDRNPRRDWRVRFDAFLADQTARGREITPESREALIAYLEIWERNVYGDPPTADSRVLVLPVTPEQHQDTNQTALLVRLLPEIGPAEVAPGIPQWRNNTAGPRGNQFIFSTEAEDLVSLLTNVPRNSAGHRAQTIPGSGPSAIRVPDLKLHGPDGSLRWRGTVIEVKASSGTKFGDLSTLSRRQIEDAVAFVDKVRAKASLVKDPQVKTLLENVHVEVFSDLPPPKRNRFLWLIKRGYIKWHAIPESVVIPATETVSRSVVFPKTTVPRDIVLGIGISIAEADVASQFYRDATRALSDVVRLIAASEKASDDEWKEIQRRIVEIQNMQQSGVGKVMEWISYGQGSIVEKRGLKFALLADELGRKYGFERVRTWEDLFTGKLGKFRPKSE